MAKRKSKSIAPGGIVCNAPPESVGWPTWLMDASVHDEIVESGVDLIAGTRHALARVRSTDSTVSSLMNPMTGKPMEPVLPPDSGPDHEAWLSLCQWVRTGKMLVLDQHRSLLDGDRGPNIELYYGNELPDGLVDGPPWRPVQAHKLNLPSGQLMMCCGEDLDDGVGVVVSVNKGCYDVDVYQRDIDAMEKAGTDGEFTGPDVVLLLKPATAGEMDDPKGIVAYS